MFTAAVKRRMAQVINLRRASGIRHRITPIKGACGAGHKHRGRCYKTFGTKTDGVGCHVLVHILIAAASKGSRAGTRLITAVGGHLVRQGWMQIIFIIVHGDICQGIRRRPGIHITIKIGVVVIISFMHIRRLAAPGAVCDHQYKILLTVTSRRR